VQINTAPGRWSVPASPHLPPPAHVVSCEGLPPQNGIAASPLPVVAQSIGRLIAGSASTAEPPHQPPPWTWPRFVWAEELGKIWPAPLGQAGRAVHCRPNSARWSDLVFLSIFAFFSISGINSNFKNSTQFINKSEKFHTKFVVVLVGRSTYKTCPHCHFIDISLYRNS
jgi:hypothetical protein